MTNINGVYDWDGEEDQEVLLIPRPSSRKEALEQLKAQRRRTILFLLLGGSEDLVVDESRLSWEWHEARYDQLREVYKVSYFMTNVGRPSLVGLLCDRDVDDRGPDTPLDAFRRTAAHYFCDPAVWSKLNTSQMENLHSLEVLEDLVHSGVSWHLPDGFGRTAWELAPEWVREVLVATQHRLARIRAGECWTQNEEAENEE